MKPRWPRRIVLSRGGHDMMRGGILMPCTKGAVGCAQCADDVVVALYSPAMATMGREAAWDADGREVEA